MTHACLRWTVEVVKGMEVFPERMEENLGLTKGLVVSEAVMMGIGKVVGRQVAHDLVYELCRKAVKEDRPLLEVLLEDEEVRKTGISKEELERLCDPKNYLGLSEEMVKRVVEDKGTEKK
ncbi:hypothetical protein AAF712_011774 [Marasmius tenuissimus]|uniref:Adenylosuccinate lyase C-terminal domain-containing protein n=1 Tax=Marasmius tenuissimus TaxID=585030 RepID=A0ABR2ZIG5_9AGAR